MDLPADVLIHNELLGIKGGKGNLVAVSEHGYYELLCQFSGRRHRVLLPVGETALVFRQPEPEFDMEGEIER